MSLTTQKLIFLILSLSSFAAGSECGSDDFDCGNDKCISLSWLCDGEDDCENNNDEKNCTEDGTPPAHRCSSNQFQCGSRECIQMLWRCDGKSDCEDGSDEKQCGPDALLYFSTIGEINGVELNSKNHIISKVTTKSWFQSFDVHPDNSQLYWVEISKNGSIIYTGNGNGTSVSILRHENLFIEDIAVDYIANNLYLTDMRFKEILACKLDGAMCYAIHTELGAPHSIALDLDSRSMYWSDRGEGFIGIYRSGMDGSGRMLLVSDGVRRPYRITLDLSAQRLYWVDDELARIEFITLDGSLRKVVLESEKYQPHAIAVFEDSILWSDRSTYLVNSCNKFSGQNVTTVINSSNSVIVKLRVLYNLSMLPKASNPCDNACSHMCLISPHGFVCVCPRGFKLSKDRRTCLLVSFDSAIFVSEESSVFYIQPQSLERDTWTKLPLPLDNINITRVAFDSKSKHLFVADVRKPVILAINLTSYKIQALAGNEVRHPVDLAFDWASSNLYWIDSSKRTAEVVSIYRRRSVVLLTMHQTPVSLAISPSSGYMFIATSDVKQTILKCGMDGENQQFLEFSGDTRALALHPSKRILFWSDYQTKAIYFANYEVLSQRKILKSGIDGLMSLAADESYVYYTAKTRGLHVSNRDATHVLMLPGEDKIPKYRRVSYSQVRMKETSRCLQNNGDCSFLCLTSPTGKTCACPSDMLLDKDNHICIQADSSSCTPEEVWCSPSKTCIPKILICDGRVDCIDGIDEKHCNAPTTVPSKLSPVTAGEKDYDLILMAEGPNIFVGVSNATGYHFKSLQSPLGPKAMIASVCYDSKLERLFVSEANRPALYVLSADWKVRELVVNNINSPKDIDFDWLSNNLYWVDSMKGTVEVTSVHNRKRIVLLKELAIPVSIALSPHSDNMFVSTIGGESLVTVYRMDGKHKRIIHSVQGVPLSLVLHPSKTVLYWTDSRAGMIMYVNYTGSSPPWILKSGISGVMSVAVSEDNVYWTNHERITPVVAGKIFVDRLSNQTEQVAWKSIALSKKKPFNGKSECLIDNGGCSYLCLTSHNGVTCSSATTMANDKKKALGKDM